MNASNPIALAAGGTGGHMFPAEALASELKRRDWPILLVTDARGARFAERFPADDRVMISAASPSIGGPVAKAAAAVSLAGGLFTALTEFRKRRVAGAVGFGGYPSFPSMKAASLLGVPYGVHEQNAILGRANRMVAAGAEFLAHGFSLLERTPDKARSHSIEIGNPVRDNVIDAAREPFSLPDKGDEVSVLIFGGSQGASLISRVVPAAIAMLPDDLRSRLKITQQARESEMTAVKEAYAAAGVRAEVAPFFSDLPARLAKSHLVIARAGASSVTELAMIGRPSVLVPLAIAMDDHQAANARSLADRGAAIVIAEQEFTPEKLRAQFYDLVSDPQLLGHMASQAKGAVRSDAAASLADLVEKMVRDRVRAAA